MEHHSHSDSDLAMAVAFATQQHNDDDDDFWCPNPNQDLILKSCRIPKRKVQPTKPHSNPLRLLNTKKTINKIKKTQGKENRNRAPPPPHLPDLNNKIVLCPIASPIKEKTFNISSLGKDDDADAMKKSCAKGMSIESRLLCKRNDDHDPQRAASISSLEVVTEPPSAEEDTHFNARGDDGLESLSFEASTQLNALIQLCCTSERNHDEGQKLEADGSCSELDEEDITSLMTQVNRPCTISKNELGKQNCLDKGSSHGYYPAQVGSPFELPSKRSVHISSNDLNLPMSSSGIPSCDLGDSDIPFRIINSDSALQDCFPNSVSVCGLPSNDLVQVNSLCRTSNDESHKKMDHANYSYEISNSEVYDEGFADEKEQLIPCPVCGIEIAHLNDEERETHTNGCLDKTEIETVVSNNDIPHEDVFKTVVDVTGVVKWLESLGLSRYADVFIKEEIDWDTLQLLTEEDLSMLGVTAFGPKRKIMHALHELRKGNSCPMGATKNAVDDKFKLGESENKLITEFFQGPSGIARRPTGCCVGMHEKDNRATMLSGHKRARNRNPSTTSTLMSIPEWLCVPGTPFRVDAFRYLGGDCCHWFLTHFHTDHYQGLTKSFRYGKVYCSLTTARLVNMRIGVLWDKLHVVPLNERINIEGVFVTFIDANHCPGSVIILFEPPNGKPVLHTGDFRFCNEMIMNPVLKSCNVHTLILDTTYCDPQYVFPKQEAVIQFVLEAIQAEAFNSKTLFLIGTYTIGKERIFLEVAKVLRKKIYVGAAKLRLLGCLGLPEEDMQWLTSNEHESHIHVVPLWSIANFKRLSCLSKHNQGRYNSLVSFSPTGWSFGKGKKTTPGKRWQKGTMIRYEVPYSEHCSFTELREFVKFVAPDNIIPSVNNDSPQAADKMVALLLSEDS